MSHGDPRHAPSPQSGNEPLPNFDAGHPAATPVQPASPPPYGQTGSGPQQPFGHPQPAPYGSPPGGQPPYGSPAPYGQQPQAPQPYGQQPFGQPQPAPYGQQPAYPALPGGHPGGFESQHQQQFGYTPPQQRPGMSSGQRTALGCGIAAVVVFVLMLGGCAAILSSDSSSSSDSSGSSGIEASDEGSQPAVAPPVADPAATSEPAAEEEQAIEAAGATASSSELEVEIVALETGVSRVSDQLWESTADGEFVVLDVYVTNLTGEPQTVYGNDFALTDGEGRSFASSDDTFLALEDAFLSETINPGVTVMGTLAFDVPVGTTPVSLELIPGWGDMETVSVALG
jgi:hypothetical protein